MFVRLFGKKGESHRQFREDILVNEQGKPALKAVMEEMGDLKQWSKKRKEEESRRFYRELERFAVPELSKTLAHSMKI